MLFLFARHTSFVLALSNSFGLFSRTHSRVEHRFDQCRLARYGPVHAVELQCFHLGPGRLQQRHLHCFLLTAHLDAFFVVARTDRSSGGVSFLLENSDSSRDVRTKNK